MHSLRLKSLVMRVEQNIRTQMYLTNISMRQSLAVVRELPVLICTDRNANNCGAFQHLTQPGVEQRKALPDVCSEGGKVSFC